MQDEWRSTITVRGEQFVMMAGTLTVLELFVDSLVSAIRLMLIELLFSAKELDQFC